MHHMEQQSRTSVATVRRLGNEWIPPPQLHPSTPHSPSVHPIPPLSKGISPPGAETHMHPANGTSSVLYVQILPGGRESYAAVTTGFLSALAATTYYVPTMCVPNHP